MKKYTPAVKSKLKRIIENTSMIIDSNVITDSHESAYNSIKEDWKSLECVIENWKQIQFTNNDFTTVDGFCYKKFTDICKTNMRSIKGICEDELAEIDADEKEKESKKDAKTIKKPKLNTGHWLTIIGIVVAVFIGIISAIYSDASQKIEIRYEQGKQEARNELNAQQNTIQSLLDSLEKIKLRNAELEKCIKLKKTCR